MFGRAIRLPLIFVTLLAVGLGATAKPEQGELALAPTDQQAHAARWVSQLLSNSRFHYTPTTLDDRLSSQIFDRYLEALDSDRLFLLAADARRFELHRSQLDDAILSNDLSPPYQMFNVYRQRVDARTAKIRELLQQEFDFDKVETYNYDREDAEWTESEEELDEIWRKRVKNDVLRLRLAGREMDKIRETLDRRYSNYGERVRELDSEDVFQTFMNAYAGAIEPHTAYMNPRTSENFNISMRLSLEGIGAVLTRDDEEFTVIRSIVPGGPADLSGQLKPGDRIAAVGQGREGPMVDVVGWRIDDVVELIRGPKDSYVRLDVLPATAGIDGTHEMVLISRQKVKLEEQAARSEIIEVPDGDATRRIGAIVLPAFYQDFEGRRRDEPDFRSATRDVAKLLTELKEQDVEGVVIDLRHNGGGSLTEAIELTGLFIDRGPVVQVKDAGKRVDVQLDTRSGALWDGPVAVLVNRASASASEIFAAAMQDYGRGLIIGERTFGKGTVQNLIDLDAFTRGDAAGLGQVKMTMAQFFRIDGGSTQHKGVEPDIAFPVTVDAEDYGESSYDNALPWTRIEPARYEDYGDFSALVPLLQQKHESRIADDREFLWLAEDIAEYRAQRERKTISLNEDARRAERDRNEARRKARDAEREAAGITIAARAESDDGLQADERDIAADAEAEREAAKAPDALLRESAHLLVDAIDLLRADSSLAGRVFPVQDRFGLDREEDTL